MTRLRRTARFAINSAQSPAEDTWDNGKGGVPAVRGLGRWFECTIECEGEPDPSTGYLVDIRVIDRTVRERIAPIIGAACEQRPDTEPGELLPAIVDAASNGVGPSVREVRWDVTPYYWVSMTTDSPSTILLAQRFEFAAAHRLHSPDLTDDENRQTYGRCNNPAGHGHNYQVEPVVEVSLGSGGEQPFTLIDLERCAGTTIIDRFDHKHLNTDVPEFKNRIPSVELIARTAHELLAPVIERESKGAARLAQITVWETEKTSATFPG